MFSWVSRLLKGEYPPDVVPSGRDALIRVIDDPASSTEQRKTAIRRLEQYKDSEAVATLARVVRNESLHDLRTDAAGRLGIMGAVAAPAVDALIESLETTRDGEPYHGTLKKSTNTVQARAMTELKVRRGEVLRG